MNKEITSLTRMQVEGIDCILEGSNAVLRMPTGSGKTISYITPGLISPPKIVIVLVPLIALLEDLFLRLHNKIHIVDLRRTKMTWSSIADYTALIRNGTSIFFTSTHETFLTQDNCETTDFRRFQRAPRAALGRACSLGVSCYG